MDNVLLSDSLREALAGLVNHDFTYVGPEADTGNPSSLWNRVKRARAALAQPEPADSGPEIPYALHRYLADTLRDGTANERAVAQTVMKLLGPAAQPEPAGEAQPVVWRSRNKAATEEQRKAFPGEEPDYLWQYDTKPRTYGDWIEVEPLYAAAQQPAAAPAQTAKQEYDEIVAEDGEAASPIERLRFFCSLAMRGQDWLDAEPFFDALEAAAPAVPAGWQPIETAPDDFGTVLTQHAEDLYPTAAYLSNAVWRREVEGPEDVADRPGAHDVLWRPPTHWMPLPAPPAQGAKP